VSRNRDVIAVTLVGFALKLPFLTQEAVTFDSERTQYFSTWEGLTALASQPTIEPHSPLYYAITFVFRQFLGSGHMGLRAPALLSAALVAPATYLLGRRLTTRQGALAAGLVAATVPYLTHHGQTARMYATAALLSIVATLLYLQLVDTGTHRSAAAYGFVAATGVWIHAFGVLVIASHLVHAVVFERPWKVGRLRGVIEGFVAAGVGTIPVAWIVLARVASGQTGGGTPEFTLKTVWVTLQGLVRLGVWTGSHETFDAAREVVALFVLLSVGGLGVRSLYSRDWRLVTDRSVTVPLVMGVVSLGTLASVSALIEPMWAGRRLAVFAPFLYLVIGIGAGRVRSPRLGVAVVTGLVVVFVAGSLLLTAPVTNPAWDEGVNYVDAGADGDDLVVSGNPHPQPEVWYYQENDDYNHVGIQFGWTEESVSSKVIGPETVWVIGYSKRADAARRVLNESGQYRRLDTVDFDGGLVVTHYEHTRRDSAVKDDSRTPIVLREATLSNPGPRVDP